jgi:hypothetical protein
MGVVFDVSLGVDGNSESSGPRRGQISSASKRASSRVRLGGSVRDVLPVVLPFALVLWKDVGRGDEGPIGAWGAKRRLTYRAHSSCIVSSEAMVELNWDVGAYMAEKEKMSRRKRQP